MVSIHCIINAIKQSLNEISLDWAKSKKATINPVNKKYGKCFQYVIIVAFSHEEIGKLSERMQIFKPFFDKYTWKATNYLSKKDVWKKRMFRFFGKNNLTIALNILYDK